MDFDKKALQRKIDVLKQEHNDMDMAITSMSASGYIDQLQLQRLKKRKLALKDEISRLENSILPNIIA